MTRLRGVKIVADVQLNAVSKRFGDVCAVDEVSLDIEPGELLCLLGPSGCGKTTTLRMIAGFVVPSAGSILIEGDDVTARPPYRRNCGMVFQDYALFPHMTVLANVMFGLKMRKVDPRESAARARAMLEVVGLSEMEDRYPKELSGGQQQRVALARVLVIKPKVLLFDEPLSNLDAKLRHQMRLEIKALQEDSGITSIFVTHDQEEALTIADRIAVMNNGRLEQVGTPEDIYNRPATKFIADFIGKCNFFAGRVEKASRSQGRCGFIVTDSGLRIEIDSTAAPREGTSAVLAVRPEKMKVRALKALEGQSPDPGVNRLQGEVQVVARLGPLFEHLVRLSSGEQVSVQQQDDGAGPSAAPGEAVYVEWHVSNSTCLQR